MDRSPRRVALVSAALIATLLTLSFSPVVFFLGIQAGWLHLVVLAVLSFTIAYGTFHYSIERFLYRKIKIIYKTIHSFKLSGEKGPGKIRMGADVLSEVNQEVAEWAADKIREVKELRNTDDYRQEFIGNLAHELKTPLFSIQGYLETLIESDLEDRVLIRRFLDRAAGNCERLSGLIKDLDQINRLESGSIPLELSRFDLVDLTLTVISSLENLATERRINLHIANRDEARIFVEADKLRIEQVITNLLMNSISYGKEGGETRVRFYDMSDNILIEVADNGLGIAKEHLPRVFERFFRVDKSRSRNEGGSGLGLAICKHIIESHHQTISVRSTEGVGSTFGFTLKKFYS
jgi:two-component system, OmpR family, phosphate regulon sensor histidine kinase PhoR